MKFINKICSNRRLKGDIREKKKANAEYTSQSWDKNIGEMVK